MALIRPIGSASTGVGTVKEIHSFSVTAGTNGTAQTRITLDETIGSASAALELTSTYNNSCATAISSISNTTVTIELRNAYSAPQTVTGNLIIFE